MPSDATEFLTVEEALAIHERLIERFGGESGVRDLGLLETNQADFDHLLEWIRSAIRKA